MRLTLRIAAIVIAIAAFVDPAIARRIRAPLAIAFELPAPSDPGFSQAERLRSSIGMRLGDGVLVDGAASANAVVLIGNAQAPEAVDVPVFALPLAVEAATRIEEITVPRLTIPGQSATIASKIRATKLAGRKSTIALELRGAVIAAIEHTWTRDAELFDARFSIAPLPGVHRVRLRVSTEGVEAHGIADAVVVARDRPVRVLAYEPRPTWPVTFVRRSLEADGAFSVSSLTRSSRPAATIAGDPPRSLAALDVDRFDALLIGALGDLTEADLRALERFVSERGGTLVLAPDRQLPESVRRRFDLPRFEEVLLEKPVRLEGGAAILASELLLTVSSERAIQALASARQGSVVRPAIIAVPRGAGTIVMSGALDAWRYRAQADVEFDRFWRGLTADGALAAPPKVDITLTPAIARAAEPVRVSVSMRRTELKDGPDGTSAGPIEAVLNLENGSRQPIRLWPGSRIGSFEGQFVPEATGRHTVTAVAGEASTDVPLLVDDDVVQPAWDSSMAARVAAESTGGALVASADDLVAALTAIDTGDIDQTTRPMRSPWWIVPFSLLLCAEWALRRRSGLK